MMRLLKAFHNVSQGSDQKASCLKASGLAPAARFRNLLIHKYWAISDEKVYESIKNGLRDFEDFVIHVRHFMEEGKERK